MLASFLLTALTITGLMVLWYMVQRLWKKTFDEYVDGDEDVLADRRSCSDCGCTVACKKKAAEANAG